MTARAAAIRSAACAAAAWIAWGAVPAAAEPVCGETSPMVAPMAAIDAPLDRSGAAIAAGGRVTIIAFGSSSTVGVGASGPADSYPSRLQALLRARYPGDDIRVVNQGVSGQDAPEEVARLARDIVPAHPDLVIWQVGTNAVLRRDDLAADETLIRRGVAAIRAAHSDLVLMDLQYAPRLLKRRAYGEMERILAAVATENRIGLFRRFALMQQWAKSARLAPAVGPAVGVDGLHMTDAGYDCLAVRLADALAAAWKTRPRAPVASAAIATLDRAPEAMPQATQR